MVSQINSLGCGVQASPVLFFPVFWQCWLTLTLSTDHTIWYIHTSFDVTIGQDIKSYGIIPIGAKEMWKTFIKQFASDREILFYGITPK